MDSLVQQYYADALAPTTRRVYSTAQSRYLEFCRVYHISPFPLTQESLSRFVAVLASQALTHRSIKVYLSAVRHLHITRCGSDPRLCNMVGLQYVLQGIKRSQAAEGLSSRPRLPITAAILRTLRRSWESQGPTFDRRMLWAAACTCFFGFLRSGEATVPSRSAYDPAIHLSVSDIAVDSHRAPTSIALRIKCSKTDPFRTGITIYLGRAEGDICPVAALLSYLAERGLEPGPLFQFHDTRPLTRQSFVAEIRSALTLAGMNPSLYSGHSFRIGAATSAAAAGIEDSIIKTLGRWSSNAYQTYVKLPREELASIAARLAR